MEPATAQAHPNTVELDWYLRRQSGVISCAQARVAGLSQDAVDRRVASSRWERLLARRTGPPRMPSGY